MAKKKKKMPGLNTSSTADISFMLLIFFLITTSMDTDTGLVRRLPPPPDENQENSQIDVKQRNILNVAINSVGVIAIKDDNGIHQIDIKELRSRAKEFIDNPANASHLPEKKAKDIPLLGLCSVTVDHVISVQSDRGTPYDTYFQVQNELVAAYTELRHELAKKKFGREFEYLTSEQLEAVRAYYPQKISEAEPKEYGKK